MLTDGRHDKSAPLPHTVYRDRIARMRATLSDLENRDRFLSNSRFIVFLVIVGVSIAAWRSPAVSLWWASIPGVVFIGLLTVHARVGREINRMQDGIRFYEGGLARIGDTWSGMGTPGDAWAPEEHPYARDLDLFGTGSLFELLNTTRTQFGEETLSKWMCAPASIDTIESRREAVAELRERLDLREALGVAGADIRSGLHPIRLRSWATSRQGRLSKKTMWLARGLTVLSFWAIAHLLNGGFMLYFPLLNLFIANLFFLRFAERHFEERMAGIDSAVQDLRLFVLLAECLEKEEFSSPLLAAHQKRLTRGERSASESIRNLERMFVALEQIRNQLFAPFAILWLWVIHMMDAIEGWRESHGELILEWMNALGEIEALCALATYSFEHPDDATATLVRQDTPRVEGIDLGHPLLPSTQCVRNGVTLNREHSLIVVSGSNMSGKSTYLRTIGINIVLALMGAPVRAKSMALTPCMVGASIRVEDSIQEGISHFYAEILRLKLIESLAAKKLPVVFLIDEILHGTNSNDRRVGTEGVMNHLLALGAIGLITTHDLELTRMRGFEQAKMRNVHFEDRMEKDALEFDYRVRDGVVVNSNALALMRSIGIDIPDP
ncbi:MAG: hypothetical protein VCD00_08575, partial [Candidatus Hydrogenedentota bacterium]